MRLALLLPVLFSVAASAHAEGARESRYGPTTPRQASATAAARYDGPMLGWANKRQASANVAAPATSAPAQPAPLAPWAGYGATPAPAAYVPPPAPASAPAQALPTSLYAPPRPTPAAATAPAPAKDWSNYRSPRMTAVAPVAAPVTAPPPPPPRQVAAADTGGTRARYYSVDRDYGLTPDPAPPAGPDNRVLVTTTEPPPEAKDATPMHGSADWLAAGARGDDNDDDDSAARRAKTRNEGL
jgi:hypothetical protein